MAEISGVQKAIRAALSDINLLRLLVKTEKAEDANAILRAYTNHFVLSEPEAKEFFSILKNGKKEINAEQLVHYYDNLEPKPRIIKVEEQPEWNL